MTGTENTPGEDWLLVVVPRGGHVPEHFHPVLDSYLNLSRRESAAGIKSGTPILISPDYEYDRDLLRYFNSAPPFTGLDDATRQSEGMEIKGWLTFLSAQRVHWLDVDEEHFTDFRLMRTDRDTVARMMFEDLVQVGVGAVPVVSIGTFAKAHYALRRLYNWASGQGLVEDSPIPEHVLKDAGVARKTPAKPKWLMPATYQLWRNVGLAGDALERTGDGLLAWGEPDLTWKGGVNASRNQAFTDLMITSALRRREQSTLLVDELPSPGTDARVASGVAKFRRGRVFTPNPAVLEQVATYQRLHRAAAVRRAQSEGRYEEMVRSEDLIVLSTLKRHRGGLILVDETGDELDLDKADQDTRMRLFRRDDDGALEPMMLWLTEAGRPMRPRAWNDVFEAANERVASWFTRIGANEDVPNVNPHVLRYTFALYLLAALHRRIDEREGYRETEAYDWRRYGAAYSVVQDMLGHKHEETTVNIYLEPVKGLRRASLFDSTVGMDLVEIIGLLTQGSDRVLRTGTVFEVED